jgi:polyhydroxybutyrate depolymerase
MRAITATLLCTLLALSSDFAADPPQPVEREWKVGSDARKAIVYAPATATKEPTPLVFAFHGHGGTMGHAARTMAYHQQWPEAVVVYMQGLNTPGRLTDPEGKKSGWQPAQGEQQDRDLKFFDAVLSSLKTEYKIDDKRIYATGHSNGGSFTYLLWAARGDVFAAVAPSAAVPDRGSRELKPKPALHAAGEQDPLVKFAWQKLMIDRLKKVNGCDLEGKLWSKLGDLTGIQYSSKTETPLVVVTHPGGHQFPANAPELITKFFQEHQKK